MKQSEQNIKDVDPKPKLTSQISNLQSEISNFELQA
jgi:hypothetical protein